MPFFPQLFSPGKIADLIIKNRVIMAAMATNFATVNGEVSDTMIEYYRARAQGGAGLIIVEASCVDSPAGREGFAQLNIDSPVFVPGLQRLAEEIKACGSRAFIQLLHPGRQTSAIITDGIQLVAPSSIPCSKMKEMPRELTTSEVQNLVEKFIASAAYARLAGFDGVELHAAHGYLINQFLSPHTNKRKDQYGGSLSKRMRFLLEIVAGIKSRSGNFPLSVRLNIDDFIAGGLQMHESLQICKELEMNGVDVINCSCGTYESGLTSIEPSSYKQGWRMYLAEAVKEVVNIPVIGGGMLRDPAYAEELLEQAKADFIFLGRPLLADPEWPRKSRLGKMQDIRPCIGCNTCIRHSFEGKAVRCAINPLTGRENKKTPELKVEKKLKAIVVGSGPAGMQAAISLAKMGIKVDLYEKERKLGGMMNLAAVPPFKDRIKIFRDYLIAQLEKADIEFHLGQEFKLQDELKADILVLASGARPIIPENLNNSASLHAIDVLSGRAGLTGDKVVIIGGGSTGCETADYLLAANKQIVIIDENKYLANDMEKKNRRDLLNRLEKAGITKKMNSRVIEIMENRIKTLNIEGDYEIIDCDHIVWAVGFEAVNDIYLKAKEKYDHVFIIGDALEVRAFRDAIVEGNEIADCVTSLYE